MSATQSPSTPQRSRSPGSPSHKRKSKKTLPTAVKAAPVSGIYQKRPANDQAFQPIVWTQLKTVVQSGSIPNNLPPGSHSSIGGFDRRAPLVKALQQRRLSGPSSEPPRIVTGGPPGVANPQSRYERSFLSSLAKDDKHARYMERTVEKLAVEVPMALKISLFEEVFPIVIDIAEAYIRVLGKHHPLTRQAHERVVQFKNYNEVISSM